MMFTRLRAYWQGVGKGLARIWQVYGKYMASSTKALDLANSWQLLYDYLPATWVRRLKCLSGTLVRRCGRSPLRPKPSRPFAVFLVLRAEVSEEAFFLAADLQEHDGDEGREDQQGLPGPKAEADAGVIDKTAG